MTPSATPQSGDPQVGSSGERPTFDRPGASLGFTSGRTQELIAAVKSGLAYGRLKRFQRVSGLAMEQIVRVADIPPRTLVRRKAAGRVSRAESERLLRLSLVFEKAANLFEGDLPAARAWLERPNKALGDETPLSIVETEIGAREVEDLIARIEHGVFT